MRGRTGALGLAAIACTALAIPASASAATVTVGSSGDDGPLDVPNGSCTFREAVRATNGNFTVDGCVHDTLPGPDTINFSVGIVFIGEAGSNEDGNNDGDIDIIGGVGGVTIDGAWGHHH